MARRTPSLQDALDEYFTTRLHTATNTQINDRSVLNGFVRFFGDMQVGHLTPQHVEQYFLGPGGAIHRYNARSYNKVRQRVAGFLAFCAARGYNRAPLLGNVHARKVMQQDRLRLTPDQMVQMLEATDDPRDRGMLAVAINTGLRASEITALRVGDVSLASGSLHVVITKSGFEDHMPVTSELDQELRDWLTAYAGQMRGPLQAEHFLFPAKYGPRFHRIAFPTDAATPRPGGLRPDARLTHPAVVVQRALRRIGIEVGPGEGFHTLRRSAAVAFFTTMTDRGHDESLRQTSFFLHHSSVQTTELYLGLQHERIKRDEALRGKPFLSTLINKDNVVPLAGRERGESDTA